ncbi:MAG TPA: prolyl aminopeptidase [Kribbellaceae bacterium]|nr:prolyl aminopeptidase [Kribbellaceae bacterium]
MLYPDLEPYETGMLDVGDGQQIYWEVSGNPDGKPALAVHGGPGSGATPIWRRFFDPEKYRVVLVDQRGCGRSRPPVSDPATDLSVNTTQHLIADFEQLREHLGIDRWLLLGGSWGSSLSLAYAEQHPDRVTELVLFAVVTTSSREVEWVTRGVGDQFPAEWAAFRDGVPEDRRDGDLAAAYADLLADPDPAVREQAARDWCTWDERQMRAPGDPPDPRYDDPVFRMTSARLVTHYWANAAFLPDGALLENADRLAGIPGVLVHGGQDVGSPSDTAAELHKAWPDSELILIDEAGHSGHPDMSAAVLAALDRFSDRR